MMDSIKKAFVLSVKALKLFYILAAVNIVANIINVILIPAPVNLEMTLGKSFAVIVLSILLTLIGFFIYGGLLTYIKELIKTGASSVASFVDNAKKYFLRILFVWLLVMLISFIVGAILITVLGILPQAIKPLFIVLIVLAVIALAGLLLMSFYALVGSDLGIIESIKKGVLVGKNNFFKILGIFVIMFLTFIVLMIVASIVSGILSILLRPLAAYISAIVMAVTTAIFTLLLNIAYMDLYLKS